MDDENVLDAVLDGTLPAETPQTGDTQGTTAPAQPVVETPAPVTAPPAATQQVHGVDLPAFLRVRDDLNAAKRQLAEYQRREQERQERESQASAQAPDLFTDPQGYRAYMEELVSRARDEAIQRAEDAIMYDRVVGSAERWSEQLGPQKWGELNEWIAQQPQAAQAAFRGARDPYGAADKSRRQQITAQRLGDRSLDDLIEEEVAKRMAAAAQAAETAAQSTQPAQPLAGQPRAPNGQFASPQSQPAQRPSAPSLNSVIGAAAPTGGVGSGPALDELYS